MLEQSLTDRTYTRDAYAPVRRDPHAKVEKINGWPIPAPSHFYSFEESVLEMHPRRVSRKSCLHGKAKVHRITVDAIFSEFRDCFPKVARLD
jgi:hypothetical protein